MNEERIVTFLEKIEDGKSYNDGYKQGQQDFAEKLKKEINDFCFNISQCKVIKQRIDILLIEEGK